MISLIAAIGKNNEIGADNKLPWNIPEDLKFFRKMTTGKTVVMGRKTFDSIGKPLPNRMNIVVTRGEPVTECVSTNDLDGALSFDSNECIVIGGQSIYEQTIDKADVLYITHVDQEVPDADAFFPEICTDDWVKVWSETHDGYEFATYERKRFIPPQS